LLALLILNANRVVSRDRLIDELWGDEPPETATTTVQVYVSRLRKVLPANVLETRPPGYVLAVDSGDIDLPRFEHLVDESRHAEPQVAAKLLREGLALWRGLALEEFDEAFARLEGSRLEESRLEAVEARIDADLACGRHAELVGELEALVGLHPRRERLHRQLALALYRSGRQAEALDAYRNARAFLDELGLEPGDELRELEQMILRHDPGLAAPARAPSALPSWPTPFVGRSAEIETVRTLVSGHRLVTLSGTGGVGKTRLASAVAEGVRERFADGAFFVGLTDMRDPTLMRPAIANALDIRADESLDVFLSTRDLLLVLDNFEQLVDGGAVLIADLLCDAPRVSVLVTSREPLRVSGEQVHTVSPLREHEAIELFVARAHDADNAFRVTDANRPAVEDVCERLDGLPLALELAAAHVRTFTPSAMLSRLDQRLAFLVKGPRDAPSRQQTIRATIEWSFALLDEPLQRVFARLGCFAGGFTIAVAEAVCDAVPDDVEALVDKNLVQPEGARFRMLETVRDFALELLEESGEADVVRGRHAEHYLALAELWYGERLDGGIAWATRLEPESDNLRAALDHLRDRSPSEYLQLAGALGLFWSVAEGALRLEDALAGGRDEGPHTARALTQLGSLQAIRGETSAGLSRLQEAIELWRALGDEAQRLEAATALGWALYRAGEEPQALGLFEQNLELARSVGYETHIRTSLRGVCQVLLATGQFERAEPLVEELRDNHFLADCAQHRRDYALAERYRRSALENNVARGDGFGQTIEVFGLAMIAGGLGQDEDAVRLEGAVAAKREELGIAVRPRVLETWRERDLGGARARLGEPGATAAYEEGRAMPWEQAVELALGKKPDG
jgi:predicted ATPase/DNA-binding SARP family transcriptional activator